MTLHCSVQEACASDVQAGGESCVQSRGGAVQAGQAKPGVAGARLAGKRATPCVRVECCEQADAL